jgi:N-acetylmuramoyl-L-alanine amidase
MRNAAPTSSVTNQPSTPVIIDPGHGGQDLGAVVKGLQEKSIALAVSWKLRDRIKDRIPVVMTREDDTYVTLDDRLVKAVDLNGAVFISIHLNHVRNKKLHGATVFSYGPEKHVARRRRHPKVPPMPAPPKFEATESDVFAGMTVKSMRARATTE